MQQYTEEQILNAIKQNWRRKYGDLDGGSNLRDGDFVIGFVADSIKRIRHIFVPDPINSDFCETCGKNSEDIDVHVTIEDVEQIIDSTMRDLFSKMQEKYPDGLLNNNKDGSKDHETKS